MSKKALCIGINDYPGTQNDLSGCVNDANDWAAALAARGFTVTKLLDAQATKAAMVASMSGLISGAAKGDTVISKIADCSIELPETIECLDPLITTVPLQLLAYHIAVCKGMDVDQPRNLAKSVTVE